MKRNAKLTEFLALLVFGVFALGLLLVLLTGARGYQNLVDRGSEQFAARTAQRYLTTRVRQAQTVAVEAFDGGEALALRETIGGEGYVTLVYVHEGWLRELLCAEGAGLHRPDGEKVLELAEVSFQMEGSLLTVSLPQGELLLFCPAGRAVGP